MSKRVYLLSVFYSKAAVSRGYFQAAKTVVAAISAGDFQLIGVGENHSAIAFTSEIDPRQIRVELINIMAEGTDVLLTQVSDLVTTNIARKTVEWFVPRLPKADPK